MTNWIATHDFKILIYSKDKASEYNAAIKALEATKKEGGWDRICGVTIHKDCRIPSLYHGDDLAIIMERDNGNGNYSIQIM